MNKTMSPILESRQSHVLTRLIPVLAAGLFAAAIPAHATLDPGAAASGYYFTNTPATGYVFGSYNYGSPAVGQTSYSHQNAAHNLSTNAFMGDVKLFNEVVRTTNGTSKSIAAGGFQDMITISDPSRTGNQGVFTGSIHIHMEQAVTGQVYNNLFGVAVASDMGSASFAIGEPTAGAYARQTYNWFGGTPISLNNDLTFSIGFTFGTAFDVGVWMYSHVAVGNYGDPGTIRHDATNTLTWNGVTSIQDTTTSTTVAPEDYTATGAQGTNWAGPVPEPASGLLFGMAAMHFLVRRPRRSKA